MRQAVLALVVLAGCLPTNPLPTPSPSPVPSAIPSPTSAPSGSPAPTVAPTLLPTPGPSAAPTATVPASPAPTPSGAPTLPQFILVGSNADLTQAEVQYIAATFAIVALNPTFGAGGKEYQYADDSMRAQAVAIRLAAQGLGTHPLVLAYVGFSGAGHAAAYRMDASKPADCQQVPMNIQQADCRAWWDSGVSTLIAYGSFDGVFIDGARTVPKQNGTPEDMAKIALFGGLQTLSPLAVTIINGDADNFFGAGMGSVVSGNFEEPVDLATCGGKPYTNPPSYKTPAENLGYLEAVNALGAAGKISVAKLWPNGISFVCPHQTPNMSGGLAWSGALAALAAGPNVLAGYSSGYDVTGWVTVNADGSVTGYPLPQPPGSPSGPIVAPSPIPSDYSSPPASCPVSRAYSGGTVVVDLCARTP